MNRFERGIDPMKAMKIGNEANPIEVIDLYAADDSIPEEYRLTPKSANIHYNSAKGILTSIGAGQVRDWENRLMIGVYTGEEQPMKNGGTKKMFTLHSIGEYKGYWILYRNKKYRIPIR